MIKFNNNTLKKTITAVDKPILNISKIEFVTGDKNWVQRLFNTSLTIKFACIDNGQTFQQQILISSFISPYHKEPIFEPNLWLTFEDRFKPSMNNESKNWETTIELNNLSFLDDESLQVSIIDREHISNRIADWKKRVENLYKEIEKWLKTEPIFSINIGNPIPMYEELMQSFQIKQTEVETADVLKGKKIVLSFKPKGLWMIGANGRLDILTRNGSYILIDTAEQFESPNWKIYSSIDRVNGKSFNEKELFNILNLL